MICEGKSVELNSVRMLFNRLDYEKKRYVDQGRMRDVLESLGLGEEESERIRKAISE